MGCTSDGSRAEGGLNKVETRTGDVVCYRTKDGHLHFNPQIKERGCFFRMINRLKFNLFIILKNYKQIGRADCLMIGGSLLRRVDAVVVERGLQTSC